MILDARAIQGQLDELAALRELGSSMAGAQQSAPHGTPSRRDLADGVRSNGREAQILRDQLITGGVIDGDGQLTAKAKAAGLRPGQVFGYRP